MQKSQATTTPQSNSATSSADATLSTIMPSSSSQPSTSMGIASDWDNIDFQAAEDIFTELNLELSSLLTDH